MQLAPGHGAEHDLLRSDLRRRLTWGSPSRAITATGARELLRCTTTSTASPRTRVTPVYAQYQRAGASRRTLSNTKGCHTHTDFNRSFSNAQTIKYRVCVKVALEPDNCSAWKWDTTG
ncbi:hypothetical protein [Streptomyces sp. OE57]|uniref:hypothetical protein n=1 Tax=Streptomyces lacaronensis TaxID=3379885 RepID=UPI0039B73A11